MAHDEITALIFVSEIYRVNEFGKIKSSSLLHRFEEQQVHTANCCPYFGYFIRLGALYNIEKIQIYFQSKKLYEILNARRLVSRHSVSLNEILILSVDFAHMWQIFSKFHTVSRKTLS